MASLTKLQIRSAVQQEIDDPNAARWSAANLDILIGLVYDELWGEILDLAPWYRMKLETLSGASIEAPGFIDLRLVADGGALAERFNKLQKVTRDGAEYAFLPPEHVVVEDNKVLAPLSFGPGAYTFLGDELWLFPLELTPEVELRYNSLPPSFTSLGDGAAITWPGVGHEGALIFEAAARALTKGDAESMQAKQALARVARERLLASLTRRTTIERSPRTLDPVTAYGG